MTKTVHALEHKQYGGYRSIIYHDVVDIKTSADGKYTTLVFSDGAKVKKLSKLIKEVSND